MVMKRDETDLEISYGLRDAQFGRVIVLKIRRSDEDDASVECIYVPYLHKRPSRTKPSCNPSAPFSQTIDAQTPMTQSGFVSRLVSAAVKCQSSGLLTTLFFHGSPSLSPSLGNQNQNQNQNQKPAGLNNWPRWQCKCGCECKCISTGRLLAWDASYRRENASSGLGTEQTLHQQGKEVFDWTIEHHIRKGGQRGVT